MSDRREEPERGPEAPPRIAPPVPLQPPGYSYPPPGYSQPPFGTPPGSQTSALLAVMAVTGAGIFLALKLGFILHDDPQPGPFASPALTGAALIVFGMGVAILAARGFQAMRSRPPGRVYRETEAYVAEVMAARERRVRELRADPAKAKYAPLVERGEDWSDENIAYYEDPSAVAMCEHLQPIERAMRAAGIDARRTINRGIVARCRIDYPALKASFPIEPPVRYAEFYGAERTERDLPMAFLICDAHTTIIHTLHPDESGASAAPLFPS